MKKAKSTVRGTTLFSGNKIQFGQVDVKYSPITMSFDTNEDFAL